MTDAFNTLREMLDGVPDDAQVYVEEREIVTEWPGITAGTFRQLLAEIEGFEAMWEQREKAHDAEVAALRAQLATAKREAGEIAWQAFHSGAGWAADNRGATWDDIAKEVYRRYPATPSGETKCAGVAGCDGKCCATPSPEAREVPRDVMLRVERESFVRITPADAKRIVWLAQEAE